MTRTAVLVTEGVRKAERFPVSRLRKQGEPARQPKQKNKLTRNERAYYEAVLDAFASIPYSAIENQFLASNTADVATPITDTLTEYQEHLGDLTVFQLDQSGTATFNGIKTAVADQWARLEKAVTPSQFAMGLNFNRASPAAVTYASMSAANMVTDMVDTQIVAVRNLVTQAYKDGLSRPQTSSSLMKLLNKMPAPRGTPTGLAGAANIFGDATRGLTKRYAMAVYHRTEKIMAANPGTTPRQLKKQAEAYGKRLQRSRARMISRTEMMRASNQGRLQGMLQAADQGLINPVLAKKQWVTSSYDVCPICVPLNGQTVGLRETFGNHGQAPPAHPNCKCVIREVPDPLTYGTPRSVGTGMTGSPMQFVRPSKPGLKIQDLMVQPGVVGQPGALVGQPGARQPTGVPGPVPDLPVVMTEEVRAEGTALIKELREQARTTAQREFDDVTGYLETLTDVNMDVSGVLARPPKVKWVRDPLLGRVRVDVRTGQPPTGNWDWYWDIPEVQKARMKRGNVFAGPGKKALGPDELADKIMQRTAIQTEGEAIDLFLDISQRRFTLKSLKDGRGRFVKESIDNKMIPELEDSGFAWEILTGEIDDDVIAGVMKWATTAADDAVDELGRLLSRSRHGTNPWQMDIDEYWRELHDVSVKRRTIQPLRTTDEFGAEYSVADQAVIDRFDELVPPNLVDDVAMINTEEGIQNLHLDILEQAAIEGWL